MHYKKFVEDIFQKKARNEDNDHDLARALEVFATTVFGNANRFIFELLQNADDSPASETDGVEVTFHLLTNYLIFSHNGKHFTESDVIGISGMANRASAKDEDIDKTGYKGIGFKSVFGTSDMVQIISDGFSFRFDKHFPAWKDGEYPWQLIPIWTEGVPAETAGKLNLNHVNTIIEIKDRPAIQQDIGKVFEDCQIILFLRHVRKVIIIDQNKMVLTIEKQKLKDSSVELLKNGMVHSSWILKDFYLDINNDLQKQLSRLSQHECPEKLKVAKRTKLTFAARIEGNKLAQAKGSMLYCYLPTKVNRDFTFLINGDFLTNAERTQLMQNIWNDFLLEKVASLQLQWFVELQATPYKHQVLNLFRDKFTYSHIDSYDTAFNKGLEAAIEGIPFLSSVIDGKLITAKMGSIDTYSISTVLTPAEISAFFKTNRTIINYQVEKQNAVASYAKAITIDEIFKLISEAGTPNNSPKVTVKLIYFFYDNICKNGYDSWLTKLGTIPFIPDEQQMLRTPKELFFPIKDVVVSDPGMLYFIHPDVIDGLHEKPDAIKWLYTLGIKDPTPVEIVRKTIIPMIKKNGVTSENALSIGRYVYGVSRSGQLNEQDYDGLKDLKLLTNNNELKSPTECYLPDEFGPQEKLTMVLVGASFINIDYSELQEDQLSWGTFLKKLGVRDTINITIIPKRIERQEFIRTFPYTEEYFDWIDSTEQYARPYYSYRNSGQHSITFFTEIAFRDHLKDYEFAKIFWRARLATWSSFRDQCNKTIYSYYGGSTPVRSYVEYYLNHYPAIPCTDNTCHPSTKVFAPHLKHVVNGVFPAADLDMGMNKEQLTFFGFKQSITPEECLQILDSLPGNAFNSDLQRQIKGLYEEILVLEPELRTLIGQSKWNGRLLAEDNTFQPLQNLFCLNIPGMRPPADGTQFFKVPSGFSLDDIQKLCAILNVPFINYENLKFTADEQHQDITLKAVLIEIAPYLATIAAHALVEDEQAVYTRILQTLQKTSFFTAKDLQLVFSHGKREIYKTKIDAWMGNLSFYFKGDWRSPLQRYTICNQLCEMLKLGNFERELELILQLNENQILEWMRGKGFELAEIDKLKINQQISPSKGMSKDAPPTELTFQETEKVDNIVSESFVPDVAASQIDYTMVQPRENRGFVPYKTDGQQYAEIQDQQVKNKVGRWAEEFVFNYLIGNPDQFSSVRWMNENEESNLPYDFIVAEGEKDRYIEVKGTPSPEKNEFYMSQHEWHMMFEKGEQYSIFRVYEVGTHGAGFERRDNPKELAEKGSIMEMPVKVRF